MIGGYYRCTVTRVTRVRLATQGIVRHGRNVIYSLIGLGAPAARGRLTNAKALLVIVFRRHLES